MRVSAIKQQIKQSGRYSVFIDGKFAFGLNEVDLLERKLRIGADLTDDQLTEYKKLSAIGKAYNATLRYITIRMRSEKELRDYLTRREIDKDEQAAIIDKLKNYGYVNDRQFAEIWIADRRAYKKRSNRRLQIELMQKGIERSIISELLNDSRQQERAVLAELIAKKLRIARYRDRQKLYQFLLRQGYSFDDIKPVVDEVTGASDSTGN